MALNISRVTTAKLLTYLPKGMVISMADTLCLDLCDVNFHSSAMDTMSHIVSACDGDQFANLQLMLENAGIRKLPTGHFSKLMPYLPIIQTGEELRALLVNDGHFERIDQNNLINCLKFVKLTAMSEYELQRFLAMQVWIRSIRLKNWK